MGRNRQLRGFMRSTGLFPDEYNIPPSSQQVLDEFYGDHGYPNEAERDLLVQALGISREELDWWCKHISNPGM